MISKKIKKTKKIKLPDGTILIVENSDYYRGL